jgi:hypothetical protein
VKRRLEEGLGGGVDHKNCPSVILGNTCLTSHPLGGHLTLKPSRGLRTVKFFY